ncbi:MULTISPECIES: biotin transporter BioY [Aphanothece]|uniref:biotin transporter BioY n=1 Tax=Aphanothece TaxID=1121 RepID=UPI003984CC94
MTSLLLPIHAPHLSPVGSGWVQPRQPHPQTADWGETCADALRALANWSGAVAGLLLILVGGLIQAAVTFPGTDGQWAVIPLPITLQVPALLLTALVCGPRSAILAAVGYLSLGLFQLPVFHGGGGAAYLLDPGFGYLAGFIPAGWVTGKLARQRGMNSLLNLLLASLLGLAVVQICGVLNLLIGAVAGRWGPALLSLLISYSVIPLLSQLLLCCAVALVALGLRRLLLVPS